MLDVAQNTARLNSLISRYYTAEFELETQTEAKLALGQKNADATIQKNKDSLKILDRYDKLQEQLAAGNSSVDVWDGMPKVDLTNPNMVEWLQTFDEKFKPNKDSGEYAHATPNTPGFSEPEILADPTLINEAMTNVSINHTKDQYCGAAPNKEDYKNNDGTEKTVNGKTYQQAKADYDEKVKEYNNKCANEWLESEKKALFQKYFDAKAETYNDNQDKKFDEDTAKFNSNRASAQNMYEASVRQYEKKDDSLAKAKSADQERQQLEYDTELKSISMQESLLDQNIQKLQAEVTAIKTEIDSLKQERNSNVQSDFKLFG